MMSNSLTNRRMMNMRKQKGFSLIEALVAFLLLTVGMLGIASLQTLSLKSGRTAIFRTAAVMKADDILDSMRANSSILGLAGYSATTGDVGVDGGCAQASGLAVSCAPAVLALDDIFRWKRSLKDILPNNPNTTASIAVTLPVPPATITTIVVTVNWDERDTASGGSTTMNYSVAVQI